MIGIPILDNLSEEELIRIATGESVIRIPKQIIQLSLDPSESPKPTTYQEIPQSTIITVCKMEIESRLGWLYLKEQLEKRRKI